MNFPAAHIFPSPEPRIARRRIYPLFLPFSGCAARCVFCAQPAQTGKAPTSIAAALERAEHDLLGREGEGRLPPDLLDLAFFGGTFTALEPQDFRACLDFAVRWQERGLIRHVRCSTRPDAVDAPRLASLKAAGFSLLELGVQSFDDAALTVSRRGYSADDARRACALVQSSGLDLGIQLMPGLPGAGGSGGCSSTKSAMRDVEECAALAPSCARLYPCLVLEGTPLAKAWRQGGYAPWTADQALDFLGPACLALWRAGVPVIRIGLAPEAGLGKNILAGPWRPDLGGMAKGLALYLYLAERIWRGSAQNPITLHAPRAWQGAFWGWRGALEPRYAALGLSRGNVHWWGRGYFALL